MNNFTIASTIVLAFLTLLWKADEWHNAFIKLALGVLAFWGALIIFKNF